MKKQILILLFSFISLHSQDLFSIENRILFANHLFCSKDYLRAAEEYEYITSIHNDKKILFKKGLSYLYLENFERAIEVFDSVKDEISFFQVMKIKWLLGEYNYFENDNTNLKYSDSIINVFNTFRVLSDFKLNKKFNEGLQINSIYQNEIKVFFVRRDDPPYKSPFIAGLLSAVVPGSGKIYTGRISDGLTAFVINSLFAFLTYDNFKHNHKFRGWLFAGLTGFFYGGNVYGSAVSASLFNAEIDYQLNKDVSNFIEKKNYFAPFSKVDECE